MNHSNNDDPALGERRYQALSAETFSSGLGFGKRLILSGVICTLFVVVLIGRINLSANLEGWGQTRSIPTVVQFPGLKAIDSTDQLLAELKAHSMWDLPGDRWDPTIIFVNYPADLNWLDIDTKKKAFLHTLLPAVMLTRAEIEGERATLQDILARFDSVGSLEFSGSDSAWREGLLEEEVQFIERITAKYRTIKAGDLLVRVDTLPVSLIMAQAAIESSWGTSRFSKMGNNLFGLWTWGDQGLVPAAREKGKNHRVAVFDSILASVRSYHLTINRLHAYRNLRKIRLETRDPLLLAEGLHRYSQRGEEYVRELKSIIRYNKLERYDRYRLTEDLQAAIPSATWVSHLM